MTNNKNSWYWNSTMGLDWKAGPCHPSPPFSRQTPEQLPSLTFPLCREGLRQMANPPGIPGLLGRATTCGRGTKAVSWPLPATLTWPGTSRHGDFFLPLPQSFSPGDSACRWEVRSRRAVEKSPSKLYTYPSSWRLRLNLSFQKLGKFLNIYYSISLFIFFFRDMVSL